MNLNREKELWMKYDNKVTENIALVNDLQH